MNYCRMLLICRRFSDCYRSKHIHIIERHLQQCLNKLADWADTNGFKFSPSKTVCIHLCKLRKPHPEPTLLLNGTPVPVVEETKFLGVIFDRKLSFIPHIKHLKDKCTKALNLLRVLAHTSWGAELLPHPVYAWKQMSPLSILGEKNFHSSIA